MEKQPSIQELVQARYAEEARRVRRDVSPSACCCGKAAPASGGCSISSNLYQAGETVGLPHEALAASLGCANPIALAQLQVGETVLDLGSGGGIDVLLSARRVGPQGKAYGLDMTDEMLELARENQRNAGLDNVEFLKGEIENIPLPDHFVDVILSNCVINLSADKDRALAEAFRVLKPGGRIALADIVIRGELPAELRQNGEAWTGCIAGALEESEYRTKLATAGFTDIRIEPARSYSASDALEFLQTLKTAELDAEVLAPLLEGKFISAFIRARKPGR
ncbi:arsenite methyltransferase [Verrucomicrobium sp. 3C]|uniref:arsenite methyltransferase n=1 Tax=Verrucomicrobium sp. 3C TaxID=1134055 RepID=UPI000363C64E|nr:arsenite methyltransferase [Verrucomicrobium sp. 3C]